MVALIDTGSTVNLLTVKQAEAMRLRVNLINDLEINTIERPFKAVGVVNNVTVEVGDQLYPQKFVVHEPTSEPNHILLGNGFIKDTGCSLVNGQDGG